MTIERRFLQVDVFGSSPGRGNPVAVVADAEGLSDEQMRAFAVWTNLSETTFLLPPTDPAADYRVRIFTPGEELPFAGHPTLGTAHAWRELGGLSRGGGARTGRAGKIVQECGAGLVSVAESGERLAFAAPPLTRSGAVSAADRAELVAGLRVDPSAVLGVEWIDNGPGWVGVRLDSARRVLALEPDFARLARGDWRVGVIGAHDGGDAAFEVRAFVASLGVPEDPVTGSLNAGLAQWLIGSGAAPASYVAAQGNAVGRDGRVFIDAEGDDIWVGGATTTIIRGTVRL